MFVFVGLLAALSVTTQAANVSLIDVFQGGVGGYACYRVPGAVQDPKNPGTISLVVEARRTGCGDQDPKDILLTQSHDYGATWGSPKVVFGHSAEGNSTYRNGYPVYLSDGSLLVQYVNSTLPNWTNLYSISRDGGATFEGPFLVSNLTSEWEGILPGPGTGIVLGRNSPSSKYAGRVVSCGTMGYHPGWPMNAAVYYSDDEGAHWTPSAPGFQGMAECQVAELANGSVMINFRADHENPCDCRSHSISNDGGTTWSPLYWDPTLIEPVCSGGLLQANDALFFSNPASKTQRVNMTVRRSDDQGHSWTREILVWDKAAAYSVLVPRNAASIGLVFERGTSSPYEYISFAAIPNTF